MTQREEAPQPERATDDHHLKVDVPVTEPIPKKPLNFDWMLGRRASAILLAILFALDVWAISSADPDFFIPDYFRPLSLFLIALFVLTGWIRFHPVRRALRTVGFVTIGALLFAEANIRFQEGGTDRVELTDDVLLRYRYRPGHEGRDPMGHPVRVNHLGLMDAEHAIPKPKDVLRVVVLTGSIANDGAIPYSERFFRRLEDELAGAAGGKRIETINVSCEGYNTLQQVRLLEQVGLLYEPDIVVVGYMLTAASIQNGGYRRIGNSFFVFRVLPAVQQLASRSLCPLFEPYYNRYTFDLVVRNSFERLALLRKQHGFEVLVAVLPIVERFDDPTCARIYDQVVDVAKASGLQAIRVADSFIGQPVEAFAKPGEQDDVCHPNPAGHRLIASTIAASLRPMLETAQTEPMP